MKARQNNSENDEFIINMLIKQKEILKKKMIDSQISTMLLLLLYNINKSNWMCLCTGKYNCYQKQSRQALDMSFKEP